MPPAMLFKSFLRTAAAIRRVGTDLPVATPSFALCAAAQAVTVSKGDVSKLRQNRRCRRQITGRTSVGSQVTLDSV